MTLSARLLRGGTRSSSKQEKTSANLVLGTLSDAGVSDSDVTKHTIESAIDGRLMLDDLNRLMTRAKRVNSSWSGGTPDRSRGITDLIVSPEIVQSLREMSYNSINSKDVDGGAVASGDEAIAATDS